MMDKKSLKNWLDQFHKDMAEGNLKYALAQMYNQGFSHGTNGTIDGLIEIAKAGKHVSQEEIVNFLMKYKPAMLEALREKIKGNKEEKC